jgi:uncharacterized protein YjbJ (UPF0337 family)
MAGQASLIASGISSGLAAAVRTAREFDATDQLDAIRRIDVTRGFENGREVVDDVAGALAETVARWQGRGRRRSRRGPAMVGLAIGIIGVVTVAAWWVRRRAAAVAVREERLDREALDRSSSEGMGTAIGATNPPMNRQEETDMTDEHTKGAVTKIEGQVEEGLGKLTDDKEQQAHGKAKQVQGDVQKGLGDVQDAVREVTDKP